VHKQENFTQETIHLGTHEHLVMEGMCKKVIKQTKSLVHEEVSYTLLATPLVFVFVANEFFFPDTCSMRMVKGLGTSKRKQIMPSDGQIHNSLFSQCQKFVASFKHHLCNKGYIFSTLALKANSGYDYIQDNCFIEQ
jgi:hypothetical protein